MRGNLGIHFFTADSDGSRYVGQVDFVAIGGYASVRKHPAFKGLTIPGTGQQ